jgi:hypothetical protein
MARVRKVKCDEAKPACYRCLSTGRVCDGYGIWGGGGNDYGSRLTSIKSVMEGTNIRPLVPLAVVTVDEHRHFEWFRHRTISKLPGLFKSSFWDTLLVRASWNEPAVLHAVLALSSAQLAETSCSGFQGNISNLPSEHERFTLLQYSRAISHLRPHFSSKDIASIRVALIACAVFVSMEYLRGNFKTGYTHLQSGLKLLRETRSNPKVGDFGSLQPVTYHDPVDDWILDIFNKLQVQSELLLHNSEVVTFLIEPSNWESLGSTFQSVERARESLDGLLHMTLFLSSQCRQLGLPRGATRPPEALAMQKSIQGKLDSWIKIYKATHSSQANPMKLPEAIAYKLLRLHYIMACIMASTCVWPDDEMIFDSHKDKFSALIGICQDIWMTVIRSPILEDFQECNEVAPKSVTDMGWIPPLYFTAIKCRVHVLRVLAVDFLDTMLHKEGIWDAEVVSPVAREVIRLEEMNCLIDTNENEPVTMDTPLDDLDLTVTQPHELHRLHNVQVMLFDDFVGVPTMKWRQVHPDGGWENHTQEYDANSKSWIRSHFSSGVGTL